MLGQARNKTKVCASGAAARDQTLTMKEYIHDILGRRKAQWIDEPGQSMGTQPGAADQAYAGLFLQELDGATNSNPVIVSIRMWQYVELTDLIQQLN